MLPAEIEHCVWKSLFMQQWDRLRLEIRTVVPLADPAQGGRLIRFNKKWIRDIDTGLIWWEVETLSWGRLSPNWTFHASNLVLNRRVYKNATYEVSLPIIIGSVVKSGATEPEVDELVEASAACSVQ